MEKSIGIIKRQTDYNEDTIIEKLKEYNNNIEKIILEYNNIKPVTDDDKFKNMSTNQKIFKTIRDNLDKK